MASGDGDHELTRGRAREEWVIAGAAVRFAPSMAVFALLFRSQPRGERTPTERQLRYQVAPGGCCWKVYWESAPQPQTSAYRRRYDHEG